MAALDTPKDWQGFPGGAATGDPRANMRKEYDFSSARRAKDVPHLAKVQEEFRLQGSGGQHCQHQPGQPKPCKGENYKTVPAVDP